jgi:hypothetical protein
VISKTFRGLCPRSPVNREREKGGRKEKQERKGEEEKGKDRR